MIEIAKNIPITQEMEMLRTLLAENQFELVDGIGRERIQASEDQAESLSFSGKAAGTEYEDSNSLNGQQAGKVNLGSKSSNGIEIRLIYLMNDAAESFLVFENARLTGTYIPEFEGELTAYLNYDNSKYILVVYQGRNAVTVFFSNIRKEVHLYNYARLGHFWVEGYEYLRNLEYHLAILRDKRDYLGKEYCTPEELRLAVLTEFPPLNYCCYPAASPEYVIPSYPAWKVSEEALQTMTALAKAAEDQTMLRWIALYRRFPHRLIAKRIASLFHQKSHARLTDLMIEKLAETSAIYPDRNFPESGKEHAVQEQIALKAQKRIGELLLHNANQRIDLVWEEPFTIAHDSIEMKAYLMIWENKGHNRRVIIESIR